MNDETAEKFARDLQAATECRAFPGEGEFDVAVGPNIDSPRRRFPTMVIIYWYSFGTKKMSKNTSITLGDHFASFVERQLEVGRYGNVSEVVRAGLRLLEERETQHQALRAAIQDGLSSGPPQKVDLRAYVERRRGTKA